MAEGPVWAKALKWERNSMFQKISKGNMLTTQSKEDRK